MSHYAAWRAYVFLLLSCFPLLLSGPAAIAPVRPATPTSLHIQTAVGSNVGPRATITCPAGAVNIVPGQSIQLLVNMYPGGTTFCLRTGVHRLTSSIKPKTGNTFVGEYGAILDGTGWTTSDPNAAAFMALNVDVDSVTVRNLAIRHMPQHGITVWYQDSNNWTIENNEIDHNKFGLEFSANTTLRNNYIHHNVSRTPKSSNPAERGGGYICQHCDSSLIENNEIAYNGTEQKIAGDSVGVRLPRQFRPSQPRRRHLVRHQPQCGRTHRRQPGGGQRTRRDFLRGQHRRHHPEQHRPAQCERRGVYLHVPECADLQQHARRQFQQHPIFPQLRLAGLGGGCEEQCGVRQHGRRRHAELRVGERLQLPLLVQRNTARGVSEWFEEPDLLPQRVPRAITLWPVHVLGRLEVLE